MNAQTSSLSQSDGANGSTDVALRPLPVVQYLRLRRHIPAMYLLLIVNVATLSAIYVTLAPQFLTITLPAFFVAVCLVRRWQWSRPIGACHIELEAAQRMLKQTAIMSGLLSLGFLIWVLMLDQYAGPTEHATIPVFIAITVLGCMFCLNKLPLPAEIMCFVGLGGYLIYCVLGGNGVAIAIAANIMLVGVRVLKVSRDSFTLFVNHEDSLRQLQAERHQAIMLGDENAQLAHSDMLTQLPNRRYFFAQLKRLVASANSDTMFLVGLIGLDRFKPINDNLGHVQGDRLLQVIGQALARICDENTQVARLSGDEFGLILLGPADAIERKLQEFNDSIRKPIELGDVRVSVSCSMGLASYPTAGMTADELFNRAGCALYHAKNHLRGGGVHFSIDLENMLRSEQAIESALQTCNFEQELALAFQPIVYAGQQNLTAVEALARWTSPKLGRVSPEQLFASAERLGIARSITLALFDQALAALHKLPQDVLLSFNLAAPDIADGETIATLLKRIELSGIDAQRLVFEVTETCLIHDFDAARIALKRLRASGAKVALDDFGTGYSSLSSLHLLPLDYVKIDRSFTPRLGSCEGRQFLSAILNLARSLNLECVFEGIETEAQLMEATLIGCKYLQGYFIAMPSSLDDVLKICAADKLSETQRLSA